MRAAIIIGTRPEIIKMSPIIAAFKKRDIDFSIIDTQQHYSDNMNAAFFRELKLPNPTFTLKTQSRTHATQIASMLTEFEKLFEQQHFDIVLVQGDTNTVLAAALMASRCGITICHVEAGLRSGDRSMPEEINRIIVDHLADYCFATSETTLNNLHLEGIRGPQIVNVGNTIVDATMRSLEMSLSSKKAANYSSPFKNYVLVTLHRPANVDNPIVFQEIMNGISESLEYNDLKAIFPVHPRTFKQLALNNIKIGKKIKIIEPLGYLDFLRLQFGATIILTDSGGVQEEACIMHIPCVTLRENTERPETVDVGANIVSGTNHQSIVRAVNKMVKTTKSWTVPYGDGKTGAKIVDMLVKSNKIHDNTNIDIVGRVYATK